MRSIKTYYEILKKKGLYTCLREARKALQPLWQTRDKEAIDLIMAERVSKKLYKRYRTLIEAPLSESIPQEPAKIIWICWLQGEEQMPTIVKRCYQSVRHWAADYEIRLITDENWKEYVTLPEHIITKYQRGIISFTHFSDILRLALLVQHGGIWMDATVLLTGAMDKQIITSPLFYFRQSVLSTMPHAGSSWFIVAQKHNPVLLRLTDLLSEYWKKENKMADYYLFHLFLYLLVTRNRQAKEQVKAMPYISNVDAHILQFSLFDTFSQDSWEHITHRSDIHKLTWKFNHFEPLDQQDTYYDYILHHLHL